jgi:hypothetical protein
MCKNGRDLKSVKIVGTFKYLELSDDLMVGFGTCICEWE